MKTGFFHTFVKKLVVALLMLFVCLATAEFVLRLIEVKRPSIMFQALDTHLEKNHIQYFEDVILNDPDLFWRLAPGKVLSEDHPQIFGLISNMDGLREDHEIPRTKPTGEIRILFLGDSCTFGFGVRPNQTFVDLVEYYFRHQFPDVPVECINAGVPGYTFAQGWRYFEKYGIHFQPDLVISSFGWNDSKHWSERSDMDRMEDENRSTPPGLLSRSLFCKNLWSLVSRLRTRETSEMVARVSPDEYRLLMERVDAGAKSVQARYIPMVWPLLSNFEKNNGKISPYQMTAMTFGTNAPPDDGVSHINLITAIERAMQDGYGTGPLFIDGVHTKPKANEYIAVTIVGKMMPWYENRVRHIRAAR